MIGRKRACLLLASAIAACPIAASAAPEQDVPTIDTEDATLGSAQVGPGQLRLLGSVDLRNGDYARGAYDDDDAGLGRLPFHAAAGFAAVLRRQRDGEGSLFLIGQTSNGFHAPGLTERRRPRSWYESNSIAALAARWKTGLTTALAYAIKVSPNGVASTTHEASLSTLYAAKRGVGWWRPSFVVTRRTRGDGGVFMLIGIAPEVEAGSSTVSFPVSAGMGRGGFYGSGSGNRAYVSTGTAVERPLGARFTLRLQATALIRDRRLAALDSPRGTGSRIVPVVTAALTIR